MKINPIANLILLLASLLLCAIFLEVFSAVVFSFQGQKWEVQKKEKNFYFQKSESPILSFELKRNFYFKDRLRLLEIDSDGKRTIPKSPSPGARQVALFGDSVTFGMGISQDLTFANLAQKKLNESSIGVQLLNFGVPGYNIWQIKESVKRNAGKYNFTELIYFLNLNDFSRNETVYQGASAGLYEMHSPPAFKSVYLLRKLIYRFAKRSPHHWYQWLYRGNRDSFLAELDELNAFCREKGFSLSVFILPARTALSGKEYTLQNIHQELTGAFEVRKISYYDLSDALLSEPAVLMDDTDHLTIEGNEVVSDKLFGYLIKQLKQ